MFKKIHRFVIARAFIALVLLTAAFIPMPIHATDVRAASEPPAADGYLDTTFGTGGIVTTDFNTPYDFGSSVVLQPDGKIVVGGETAISSGNFDFALARYMPDGSLDTTLGSNGRVTTDFDGQSDEGNAVALQADGKILLAGYTWNQASNQSEFALARFNSNGSLDITFDMDGKVITSIGDGVYGYDVVVQPDGKIVIVGEVLINNGRDFVLVRYNSNGSLDTGFGVNGITVTDLGNSDGGYAVLVQPLDWKMIVAGYSVTADNTYIALARYNSNGSLDTTFDNDGKVITVVGKYDHILDLALQADGKILAAGTGENINGSLDFMLVRYDSNGSLDTTFDSDGKVMTDFGSDEVGSAVAVQPDGRILMAGAGNSRTTLALARYLSNGSLDSGFGINGKVTTSVPDKIVGYDLALQPDHNIIVVGGCCNSSNVDFMVARYINYSGPRTLYVKGDAKGANKGTSWTDAYTDLQSALTAANPGDEIWVAAETYKPTTTIDRAVSFPLKNGVKVYGGFAGNETQLSQRDLSINVSILSGDIGEEGVNTDNSYHVISNVNVDNTARLDGFTISNGNADDQQSVTNDRGGGMYNKNSVPELANLIFDANSAYFLGGGMYNYQSAPSLTNVLFTNNSAEIVGGGMFSEHSSSPVLKDVTFSNNTADSGGGMANLGSGTPSLTDVTFEYNNGGGMTNVSGSNSILTRVNFIGNSVDSYGAGMYNSKSNPTLMDVKFEWNTAGSSGGGMYNRDSTPVLTDVIFENNAARGHGGGMVNKNSSPTVTNVTFQGNGAAFEGGGMWNVESSNALLTNVTFFGNNANTAGGAVLNASSNPVMKNVTISGNHSEVGGGMANVTSNPILTNVIFWGNTADSDPEIFNTSSTPVITYSIVQGGYTGTGNLNADPKLGPLANYGGFTKTLALLAGSPAIDAGSNASCPAKDQRGRPRPSGTRCDMGAYEVAPTFVDVPVSHPYYQDIEILYANNMTGGCSTNPLKFCPDQIMNRAQAAAFMLRGNFGPSYVPPVPTHIFKDDWSKGTWAEGWAEGMRNEGFSAGCLANPLKYCPWDSIPREQAVIFALKLKYGKDYMAPPATGTLFADMSNASYYATSWAEQAYKEAIIQNCGMSGGKPNFCPKALVSRGLAAYMIVRAKNLTMP